MRERDLQHGDALLTRRAQLIAAAEALVVWVHDRRAAWANDPLPLAEGFAAAPAAARPRSEPVQPPAPVPAYRPAPVPVFESPAAPRSTRPEDAPYEAPPAYQPYEPKRPAYEPPAPAFEPPPAPTYDPPPPADEPPSPPAYETPSRYDAPVPASPAPYQPFAPAAAAPLAPPAPTYEPPAVAYQPPSPYVEPGAEPAVAPPPPPIRVEPPTIAVQEYVPPARVETTPPIERPQPPDRPRQRASEVIAPVARWGVRLGVAAAIIAALLVGAARVRPYLTNLSAPSLGTIVIESAPTGSEVSIDGKPAGQTPFSTEVAAGRHILEFRRKNLTRTVEVEVAGGKMTTSRLDWSAKPVGRLIVESEPTGAKVTIDGKLRGATPLTLTDMSVGTHTVVIDSEKGSIRKTVEVTSERETTLSETIFSGFLKVFAPFEVTVSEAGRGLRLDERAQLMLAPGVHDLRFENKQLGFYGTRKVEIEPGKTATVTLTPGGSTLSVTASAPAEVLVDGQRIGETPVADYPIALGTRDIVVKGAAGERRFTQTITTQPLRLEVDFSKP